MVTMPGQFPRSLLRMSWWTSLGGVPAVIVHPARDAEPEDVSAPLPAPVPTLIWMHGRTASKEIDPGRYLRLAREGIASIGLDLPGHGGREDRAMQEPARAMAMVEQMAGEIDGVVDAARDMGLVDMGHLAIGGMSAGGMASCVRLCAPHPFRCALIECSTGDFASLAGMPIHDADVARRIDPMTHLDGWRDIPFLALHARHDEWMPHAGAARFVEALRARSAHPDRIAMHTYERTGAVAEHIGFGQMSHDAKTRGCEFLMRYLRGA
jgi:alpha-beta hydrolase superfamily lysophospholipase